jgi:hypothetical protein
VDTSRLAGVPVFAGLPEEELAAIAAAGSEVEVGEGETIATEGDFGHALISGPSSEGLPTPPSACGR